MQTYTLVRENWLTRKLAPKAALVAALTTFSLLLVSLMYWGASWNSDQWLAATRAQVFNQHQYWRAWTTLFVHADLRHLVSNSLLFFIVGIFLNGYFGFGVYPFLALLMGGFTNLLVLHGMVPDVQLIGASGVVFWMGGFWLVMYFLIDRRRSLGQRALRAIGVALMLFMPAEAFDPSISYLSHLTGFASGLLSAFAYYFIRRRQFAAAERYEVITEEDIAEAAPLPSTSYQS